MKLQACSKIITLAALGFTLTAAGAFYSLISAEHTIDANYQQELKERFTAVGADLNHYVQRINGDYYELINSSLSNILALDQSYYRKDPLLNFFEQNIRTGGAYISGENLVYALEGLNYFGVPYIAYNLDSKELTVHGLKDHNNDESTQHLLKARNQNGQTLEEMISEPQTLAQSFTIFYSGSDTYLCLRLFDQDTNSNYYIVSSYLEVLDNIALNLKKVFSDIDPMLQGILKDDAVMIVRRGQPILKSKDFDLALDMSSSHLRELIGVRLIDQDGNLLDDASSITQEHQASILAVSYVRSINSYLLVKRPFDLIKSDTSLILLAKIFTIVLSLLSVGLIARVALKDNQGERRNLKMLSSLVRKLNDMSPADFKQRLQQAYVDLQPQAAHTPNSDVTAAGAASATATSADSAAETTSNNTEADSTTATDKEQTANVEAASAAHAAPNTSAEDVNGETASDVQAEAKNAIETEGSNNSSAQGALAHDSVKESEAQAAVSQQASDSTEKSDAADATQSSAQDTNAEHVTDANTPLTASASDATEKSSASLSANSLSPDSGTSDSHDSKPADSKSNMESVTNVQLNTIKPEDVTAKHANDQATYKLPQKLTTKSKALFTILGIAMPIALVGAWYFLGDESEQSRASMLFDQCQANDAEACTQLGLMYQDGEEVKANPYVAQALFTKGCSLQNADACGYLGQIYAKGKAVDIRSLPDLPGQASYSEQDIEQMRLMLLEGENSRNVLKFEPEQKLQ